MNHSKVIQDVIQKYADFPSVQKDMKKLLGYIESQQRMFISATLKTEPTAPAPRSIGAILATYSAPLRREMQAIIDSVIDIAATAAANGCKRHDESGAVTSDELISLLIDKHFAALQAVHGDELPATLRADLEFICEKIVKASTAAARSAVDDLINGVINVPA